MNFEESLAQVQRLLGLLPGVDVTYLRGAPDVTCIELGVTSQESLTCLAYLSFAANVQLAVGTASGRRRLGDPWDPAELRYVLKIPKDSKPGPPPDRLQIMGIYLARELKACQLLDPLEANQLQVAWNAVAMWFARQGSLRGRVIPQKNELNLRLKRAAKLPINVPCDPSNP